MSGPALSTNAEGTSVLLLGAGGMLGRAFAGLLSAAGASVASPPRAEVDLSRPLDRRTLERWARPTIINCAAWTDVDGAESSEDAARAVNGDAVEALAACCEATGATLVHFSTDYVFGGDATEPYPIDGVRSPINAYGRTKAVGELALAASRCRHLTIRTSWLYAPWGKNFVRTIAKLAGQRPTLSVVNDQRGRPTSAEHLARTTLAMLQRGAAGFHHVTDGGECTWYDFAREIVRLAGAPCEVTPCDSAAFPRPARRPAYSVLDLTHTEALVGPMPDWRRNLADVVRRLEP